MRPAKRRPSLDDAETANAPPETAAHEHATEADRLVSLGFLASSLAHEVNNALTPMRLSLGRLTSFELSRRPMSAQRMHRIELLQDVREGVARIERIVRELCVFSHTDDATRRTVAVSEVLEMAIGLADHEIKHRARLLRDDGDVPAVAARPADLCQAILNVLINAARSIPEGEAHLNEIRVTTRADERGFAAIEISDTGKGIRPDDLPRIFDPFFTTEPAGRALGLGLALTRDVIMASGGDIDVDSVLGKGTTIRIALPPSDMEEPVMTSKPDSPPRQQSSVRQRVLIVDDDRPVAAAIALELRDHDVVVAESGREALKILRCDKDFDVILCDLDDAGDLRHRRLRRAPIDRSWLARPGGHDDGRSVHGASRGVPVEHRLANAREAVRVRSAPCARGRARPSPRARRHGRTCRWRGGRCVAAVRSHDKPGRVAPRRQRGAS